MSMSPKSRRMSSAGCVIAETCPPPLDRRQFDDNDGWLQLDALKLPGVRMTRVILVGCLLLLEGCASIGQAIATAAAASAPLSSGYRIVAPAAVAESSPTAMIERLTRADVVFF